MSSARTLALLAASLVAPTLTHAAAILAVDVNVGTSPSLGGTWTDPNDNTSAVPFTGRVAASNADTTWTFTGLSPTYTSAGSLTFAFSGTFNDRQDRGTSLSAITGTFQALYRDVVITNAGQVLTITGLVPAQKYELYIQAFEPAAARFSNFTPALANLASPTNTTVTLQTTGALTPNPAGSLTSSNASVSFANANALTADPLGRIVITPGGQNGNARINGFQLAAVPTVIPEPAALGLLPLTSTLLLRRRR